VDVSLKTKDINGNMDLSRFVLFPEKLNDLIASKLFASHIFRFTEGLEDHVKLLKEKIWIIIS
jgi:hypothetical protein